MPQPALSKELMQQAVNAVALYGNILTAANRLGVSRGAFENRLRRAKQFGIKPDAGLTTDELTLQRRQNVALADRVRDLELTVKAMHRQELTEERISKEIFGLASNDFTPPKWTLETKASDSSPGAPSVLWSDWHWGEVVNPAQVNAVNKFNLDIARKRLKRAVAKTVDLCFNHMVNPNYPGIVVNLAGDMLSGDIHEELVETNELPSGPILLDLVANIIAALDGLVEKFNRVHCVCVAGNHGRTTRRPRFKDRAYTNFDWIAYKLLAMHYAKDRRFSFLIPDGADAWYPVYGHSYLLTHGDNLGVRGGDGIIGSLGPILRGDVKIRAANSVMQQPYQTLLMGHWHQYLPLFPRLCVNGTLKGFDEFAMLALRAPPEPPSQTLWFTHPRVGITSSWRILLEDAPGGSRQWIDA